MADAMGAGRWAHQSTNCPGGKLPAVRCGATSGGGGGPLGDGNAVASAGFRLVEGAIGARNHGLELFLIGAGGKSERDCDVADALLGVGAANLAVLDCSANALGQLDAAGAGGMGQQHGEFLATDTGNGTALADACAQYI